MLAPILSSGIGDLMGGSQQAKWSVHSYRNDNGITSAKYEQSTLSKPVNRTLEDLNNWFLAIEAISELVLRHTRTGERVTPIRIFNLSHLGHLSAL